MTQYGRFNLNGALRTEEDSVDELDGGDSIIEKIVGEKQRKRGFSVRHQQHSSKFSISPDKLVLGASYSPSKDRIINMNKRLTLDNSSIPIEQLPGICDQPLPDLVEPVQRRVYPRSTPISSKKVTDSLLNDDAFKLKMLQTEHAAAAPEIEDSVDFSALFNPDAGKKAVAYYPPKLLFKPAVASGVGVDLSRLQEAWASSPNRVQLKPIRARSPGGFTDAAVWEEEERGVRGSRLNSRKNSQKRLMRMMTNNEERVGNNWVRASSGFEERVYREEAPRLVQSAEKKRRPVMPGGGMQLSEILEPVEGGGGEGRRGQRKKKTIFDLMEGK